MTDRDKEMVSGLWRSLVLNVFACGIMLPVVSQHSGLSYSIDGFRKVRQCSGTFDASSLSRHYDDDALPVFLHDIKLVH